MKIKGSKIIFTTDLQTNPFKCRLLPGDYSALTVGVQRIDKIANSSMTASSWKPGYYPYAARLYRSIGSGSWCAAAAKKDEYLQVDLGTQYNLVKIGLQGDTASGSGVKRFYIAYSGNGGKWTDYMIHGVAKVGRGGGAGGGGGVVM